MASRKRACKFTDDLQKEYPFIKKSRLLADTHVYCKQCNSEFSLVHGGKNDISRHLLSEKHKKAVQQAASSSKLTTFMRRKEFGQKEKEIALSEAVMAFHTICHNHSLRSMDCTSDLVKKFWEPMFACARTKTQAIIVKVWPPMYHANLIYLC